METQRSCLAEERKPPYQVEAGPIECYEKADINKGLWENMRRKLPKFEIPVIAWLKSHM